MRILILVDSYYPSTKAAAQLMHDLAFEFHKAGHGVILATASESANPKLQISLEEGIQVVRIRTGKMKGACKLVRGFHEACISAVFWSKAQVFLRQNPCDLILFYSPTIFFGRLVGRLKSLWRCPAYLILRDIFPQWAIDAGVLKKGIVYKYLRRKELEQYVIADVIAVQSPANLKYFEKQFPANDYRLEVLYNWTSTEPEDTRPSNYRRQLGLENKVVFVYGGNMGVAQDMDNILRLAHSLLDEPGIAFLLVGEGSEASRVREAVRSESLSNVSVFPAISQREYLAMLAECDVGIISLNKNLTTQNIPGKLLGYLRVSIPVLASINPGTDLTTMLEASESGLCSINGEDERFRENALTLAYNAALRKRMGRNAHNLLQSTFLATAAAKQILSDVEHLRREPVRCGLSA